MTYTVPPGLSYTEARADFQAFERRRLTAARTTAEKRLTLTGAAAVAAATSDTKALRKFALDAYNGGAMSFTWSEYPVVVDLAGLDLTGRARPILKDHDTAQVVGHSEQALVVEGKRLAVAGLVSGTGPAAQEVVANADNGFPWQASIGIQMDSVEEIPDGTSVTVNGQSFTGPLLIVRASTLGEVSFVALGADDTTSGRMVAAKPSPSPHQGNDPMTFEDWLKSLGLDAANLTPEATAALKTAFEAQQAADQAAAAKDPAAPEKAKAARLALTKGLQASSAPAKPVKPVTDPVVPSDLQASREAAAADVERIGAIRTLCAGAHPTIEAQAIREGWTRDRAELAVLRAQRPTGPNIGSSTPPVTGDVLQAAVMQATRVGTQDLERRFSPQILEAAQRRFRGRISLQELFLEAAQANGFTGRSFRQDMAGCLRAAFGQLNAGFSTVDIPGILSTTANKFLIDGFASVESAWRMIAAIKATNDLKTITSYRLTGGTQYEKVGPSGEIKAGALSEESYTNKAETYGKLFGISRRDLINDDLGALSDVPRMLGRGGALKLNDVFWTAFMADGGTFYTAGRKNYFTGAATTLQISSLTTAVQMFRDQTDAEGKPLGIAPALLVVPTALEVDAENLFNGNNLVVGALGSTSAKTTEPNVNPHARRYKPVVSAYLGNSAYTGYSATAWYLAANPSDLPLIEVVFLNGQESPTVETADADFSTLGIQMRGYHDFGCTKQDHRAAVKSKGAA